jgi:hypothetical protein
MVKSYEFARPAQVIKTGLMCGKCDTEMKCVSTRTTNLIWYVHECPHCGATEEKLQPYPIVEYEWM